MSNYNSITSFENETLKRKNEDNTIESGKRKCINSDNKNDSFHLQANAPANTSNLTNTTESKQEYGYDHDRTDSYIYDGCWMIHKSDYDDYLKWGKKEMLKNGLIFK